MSAKKENKDKIKMSRLISNVFYILKYAMKHNSFMVISYILCRCVFMGIGAFIDTFVVLTMTALVAIVTLYAGNGPLADGVIDEGISKSNMITIAFSEIFGDTMGSIFVAICLLFFAFSSIIGWNVFVKINVQYLFGKKAIPTYSALTVLFIFVGSLFPNDLVWELADMFNNFMVIPNIMALIALSGIVINAANTGKK